MGAAVFAFAGSVETDYFCEGLGWVGGRGGGIGYPVRDED